MREEWRSEGQKANRDQINSSSDLMHQQCTASDEIKINNKGN